MNSLYPCRGGDLFALHQLATSGGPTPKYGTGTGKAPGWRTDDDVARIIVWYGEQAGGTESANVDEVIAELLWVTACTRDQIVD